MTDELRQPPRDRASTATDPGTTPGPVEHQGDEHGGAFVIRRGGETTAELTYRRGDDGSATLDHTFVSESLRGQGVALLLVRAAVEWARAERVRLVPVCTYARAVFRRHEDLGDVL